MAQIEKYTQDILQCNNAPKIHRFDFIYVYVLKMYRDWRVQEIKEDMEYCHPRWPEEKRFLEKELEVLHDSQTRYFSDMW